MHMMTSEPEPTTSTVPDVCARPVSASVLGGPRAEDGVLHAELVGHLAQHLDTLEEDLELELGTVIGPRAPRGAL